MAWYHVAQISAFVIAGVIAYKTPRASLWAACLGASYIMSVLYLKLAPTGGVWPPSQLVGLLLDGAVLLIIREFSEDDWESRGLVVILAFMVTADVIQLFGVLTGMPTPFSRENYGIILEVLNYLALALIGGVGLLDMVSRDGRDMARNSVDLLHRSRHYAHSKSHQPQTLRRW
jgi:hypothetical protein